MDRAIIQWNAENWITIVLMVAIMYFLAGTIAAFLKGALPSLQGGNGATSTAQPTN